jgi:V-type H+-transporting ATPase subunit C
MHIIVSLPLDKEERKDVVLGNVRKGLGSVGRDCDLLDIPSLETDTIDNLFEAEEKTKLVGPLAQETIRKFLEEAKAIGGIELEERAVLGRTFDHYIKTFQWDNITYSRKEKIGEMIKMMEEEIKIIASYYDEKIKTYAEQKRRRGLVEKKTSGNIYEIDINGLVHSGPAGEEEGQATTTLLRRYYIVVPEAMRAPILQKLSEVDGLFMEARHAVYKTEDGEIIEMLGKSSLGDSLEEALAKEGIKMRVPFSSPEEYRQALEADKKVVEKYEDLKLSMLSFIKMHLSILFKILLHVQVLSLYIESILRFGLPASFCFFVTRLDRDKERVLSNWKRVVRHWDYSERVIKVSKMFREDSGETPLQDFVYSFVKNFTMDPIEAD